jgi:uncharacterized protein
MDDAPRTRPKRPCPICGKPTAANHMPFCSERCALLDLGRWLGGRYRIETEEKPEDAPSGETVLPSKEKNGG